MSAAWVYASGSYQSSAVEFCAFRWGGGAEPGKWHVFVNQSFAHNELFMGCLRTSTQCVVDDFGNLSAVQS